MDFGRALGIAFTTGSGRPLREGETDETEQVGWGPALGGIVLLVAVQLVFIPWTESPALGAGLVRDLGIVALGTLVVPFAVIWLGALITGTTPRLPAAFLYLAVSLAVLQLFAGALAMLGTSQIGFVIGLRFAIVMLAARGFLKLGWIAAIGIGILVIAGYVGANLLLLLLPSGALLT